MRLDGGTRAYLTNEKILNELDLDDLSEKFPVLKKKKVGKKQVVVEKSGCDVY